MKPIPDPIRESAVNCNSIEEFILKYYKPELLKNEKEVQALQKKFYRELFDFGYCVISPFDCVTSECVAYLDRNNI